ncbi:uncharacterized protein LOC110992255 [Pieris rapae]|uniref:uncharacterized protein LOC110992255 n=1 Tax=Pieris rapae TaxID=64459 RepID=UPI001E27B565|nr:uncharacterized protein LOC110992255 [Pieris rapae]
MVRNVPSIILKCCSLGCVIAAGGLWAGTELELRPKNRDEQTLVGGAIWSQTTIPLGLIISLVVEDKLYTFVHAYFLFAGAVLLVTTGLFLVCLEFKRLKQHRSHRLSDVLEHAAQITLTRPFDKIYFTIGVLCILASILTFLDFLYIIIM